MAAALAEAHKHNVIHRDLKPANIMIDLKKEPIVMDFGLARQMDVESRVTQSGMAVGTPAYMSPEQIRGELDEVGISADIYALGVILYELLTGQLPFRGPIAKVVYGIVNETPAAPSQLRDDVDPELESICSRMMAKTREERYASMEEVATTLKAYLKGGHESGQAATSATSIPAASSKSNASELTETGALNAFFAAQADSDSRGTMVEQAAKSTPAPLATPRKTASQSNRNSGGRNRLIAAGFAGGVALLLGIIIYFNGGRVELDPNSDAVVNVDNDGTVTIRPGSETKPSVPAQDSTASVAQESLPADPPDQANLSSTDPKVELLNEWEHDGKNWTRWHLASLSPDGNRVAFRLGDGPLTISDTNSKQVLKIPAEMEDATSIAFSSDGRLIATGHDNKQIRLWDADTLAQVSEPFESPIEPSVAWVHLSADGTKLLAMANDHAKLRGMSTFLTWDISTRNLISRFQAGIDDQRLSDSIDASADGRLVAVNSLRGGPTLWDTTTGKNVPIKFEFDEKVAGMKRITGMDLSADGSRIAYGTLWGADSKAIILDTSTGKELWRSRKQAGRVHCVQFTGDGKHLASTAAREGAHQLSLWDVESGDEIERWTYQHNSESEHADRVKFLSFSDDGSRLLLSGGHIPVVVWSLAGNAAPATGVPARVLNVPRLARQFDDRFTGNTFRYYTVEFSPDGHLIDAMDADGRVRAADVETGQDVAPPVPVTKKNVQSIAWSGDGSQFVLSTGSASKNSKPQVEVWQAAQAKPMHVFNIGEALERPEGAGGLQVRAVGFSADGTQVIAAARTSRDSFLIKGWNVADGAAFREFFVPANHATGASKSAVTIDFSSDLQLVAVAGTDGVEIWNLASQQRLKKIASSSPIQSVFCLEFSHDSSRVVWGGRESRAGAQRPGVVFVSEVSSGDALQTWHLPKAALCVAFSPDDSKVAAGSFERQSVTLWETRSGNQLSAWTCPMTDPANERLEAGPRHLAFSPDGRYLATAGYNSPLCVWNLETASDQRAIAEKIIELGGTVGVGPLFSDERIRSLEELPEGPISISYVYFGSRNISLDGLTSLKLDHPEVSDAGLRHIEHLGQLESLHLRNTNVTPAGVEGLQAKLPNCQIYHESIASGDSDEVSSGPEL